MSVHDHIHHKGIHHMVQVLASLQKCTISERARLSDCMPPSAAAWALAHCSNVQHLYIDCSTATSMSFVHETLSQHPLPLLRHVTIQHAQAPLKLGRILAACPHLRTLEIGSSALDLQKRCEVTGVVYTPARLDTLALFWCRVPFHSSTRDLVRAIVVIGIGIVVIGIGIGIVVLRLFVCCAKAM